MNTTLGFIHRLEIIQDDMRVRNLFEAARSLEIVIEHLRQEYGLHVIQYENRYQDR